MDLTFTDWQAFGLVVLAAVTAIAAIGLPFRPALVSVGVASLGYAAAVRTTAGAFAALFVGLLGVVVGTVVKQRQESAEQALEARVQHELRSALARDLHDVLAHSLSGLALQLEQMRLLAIEAGQPELVARAASAHGLARRGVEEARIAVSVLRGDDVVLADAIDELLAAHVDSTGVSVDARITGSVEDVPVGARVGAYRVVQEALSNVRRHGDASRPARVVIEWGHPTVVCVASAAGSGAATGIEGFAANGSPSMGSGFGLAGLRERVALLGGTLTAGLIEPGPRGTGPREPGNEKTSWQVRAELP